MSAPFVYFIKPIGMDGPVKIGCSADPVRRLKALMVQSPFALEIAAAFPGTTEDESALHGTFAVHRLHGEWFNATPRLLEMIEAIRRGDPLDCLCDDFARGKSAMRVASGIKSALTLRIHTAEKQAQRRGLGVIRPDHIRQLIGEYTGPDKPAPTTEHHALVDLYVRELRTATAQAA